MPNSKGDVTPLIIFCKKKNIRARLMLRLSHILIFCRWCHTSQRSPFPLQISFWQNLFKKNYRWCGTSQRSPFPRQRRVFPGAHADRLRRHERRRARQTRGAQTCQPAPWPRGVPGVSVWVRVSVSEWVSVYVSVCVCVCVCVSTHTHTHTHTHSSQARTVPQPPF
jgi:hypothetical protein